MKRSHIRITVSDLNKTHHFQIPKKLVQYILMFGFFVMLIIVLSFITINYLSVKAQSAEQKVYFQHEKTIALKENIFNLLKQKNKVKKLLSEKSIELRQLEGKMSDIEKTLGIFGEDSPQADLKLKELLSNNSKELNQLGYKIGEMENALSIINEDSSNVVEDTSINTETELEPRELEKRLQVLASHSAIRAIILDFIPSGSPLNFKRISSPYGKRIHPISQKKTKHLGIDITADKNTRIYAPASGVIRIVRLSHKGYGNYILIDHAFGFSSLYGHLAQINVKRGEFIKKGAVIGLAGSSGDSTGPHLHYEIRYLNVTLNPINFMNWNGSNFYKLFKEEKHVKWESLIRNMKQSLRVPLQLSLPKALA